MNPLKTFTAIQTKDLSLVHKIGQCLMPAVFLDDTEEEIVAMEHLIQEHAIGSLCFFQSRSLAAANVQAKPLATDQSKGENYLQRLKYLIKRYQGVAPIPLLIAIDGEWGLSMRLPDQVKFPYALSLGAMQNQDELIEATAYAIGRECLEAGVHWNLAPVVDINSEARNPVIGYRSFGGDAHGVIRCATAWTKGLSKAGVLNSLKHFPGHGDTALDSHLALPVLDKSRAELEAQEWLPFKALLGIADSLMLGHLAAPQLTEGRLEPATLSSTLTQVIRSWDYDGLLISDALNMKSVSEQFPEKGSLEAEAFAAGCDVLCFSDHPKEAIVQIEKAADPIRINASFNRIWELKQKAFESVIASFSPPPKTEELLSQLAQQSLTLYHGEPTALEAIRQQRPMTFFYGEEPTDAFRRRWPNNAETPAVLMIIQLPSPKPGKGFGLRPEELERIKRLLGEKRTWIYLFGNPYFLLEIPWKQSEGIVLLYEKGEAFEEVALAHFQGKHKAVGQLPVKLETDED